VLASVQTYVANGSASGAELDWAYEI
jgi:hypothetical protein